MLFNKVSVLAMASAALAVPNHHVHHMHKRDEAIETVVVTATTLVYVTDGESTTAVSSSASTVEPEPTSASTTVTVSPASSSAASSSSSSSSSAASSSSSSNSGVDGDLSNFSDPSSKFEDGVYSCDSVPTGQGVVSVDWVGLSGWASILNDNGDTVTTCQEGYYCSYACQAGMSKTQWPSSQLSDGQTRGGLVCKNGKLYRTNTNTDYLCEWGAQSANAVSKVDKVISLCRTDYPGSENMVVPTRLTAGSTKPISVVIGESYFKWQGKVTSAQYYVNDAGVDVEEGCVWGTDAGTIGNWAPVVLGAGQTGSISYLSIIPNPNNKTPPSYSLKIEAADGGSTVGSCVYAGGSYSGGSDGCTVSVTSGTANFVFY